ncbi:MAG: asparagine--tRNA ligase [Candidatus Undinarchaeales archaeon]|jgi:asparaginyl-tRNA synthetase|nr:asparagine--tRNA ligase [Candidatus Undinarchaeales archaeon]
MEFIPIKQALSSKQEGKTVSVRGWVYRERKLKDKVFIVLRDSSEIIQVIVKTDSKKAFSEAKKVTMESSIQLSGKVRKDGRAPTGYEIDVDSLEIVGLAERFPITKDQSPEFLLDNRHLWLRSRRLTAILKIRHTVMGAIHEFFRGRGYFEFDPPVLTPNACEGAMTLFEVKYFDEILYLSQSWQLYAEAGIFALEKIYDVSPTFRAEPSKTSMHIAEFWMAEMEAAWMKLDEVTEVAKDEIRFIIQKVLKENKEELKLLERDIPLLEKYAKEKYPTITYTEALKILDKEYKMKVPWGKDLRTKEEELLGKHFGIPVVVTYYPKEIMAFYKPPDPKNPKVALCFDMIAPEGYREIVGGSERSTDIEQMKKDAKKKDAAVGDYDWYFDLRRYGNVPHSGYGVGVERVIAWICGIDNIKEAVTFPRTMNRSHP